MTLRKLLAIAVAAVTLTTAMAGTTGPAFADSQDFSAQAERAGLTNIQAKKLQGEIDNYLAEFGGKQVAANKIELAGTGSLVVPLPGERYARDLAQPASILSTHHGCLEYYFCMYRGTNYSGTRLNLFYCNEVALSGWVTKGSYVNNQLPYGSIAALLKRQNHTTAVVSISYDEDASFDWYPIWYVDPC
jgi:hypothetical protein